MINYDLLYEIEDGVGINLRRLLQGKQRGESFDNIAFRKKYSLSFPESCIITKLMQTCGIMRAANPVNNERYDVILCNALPENENDLHLIPKLVSAASHFQETACIKQ